MRNRIAVAAFIAAILLPWNASALTQEQIGAAVQRGRIATDVKQVPAYLVAGTKAPKGDFARTLWLGISSPPFVFLIRSCSQWIPNYVLAMTLDGKELDQELIRSACLDKSQVRVFVGTNDFMASVVAGQMGYTSIPSPPVTQVRLRVDGELVEAVEDPMNSNTCPGSGSCSRLFDGDGLRAAKKVEIVATIGSQYMLTQPVPAKVLRALFQD